MWNSSRFVIFFFFFLFECLPSFDARPHTLSSCSNTQREEKLFLSLEQSKEREMELESELESTKSAVAELEVHPAPFFWQFFCLGSPSLVFSFFFFFILPQRTLESTRTTKDLEIKNLQTYVEGLQEGQSGQTDSAEAAELRFDIGRLEQALKTSEEETLKHKQKVAKLEQKARRMTDVRDLFATLSSSILLNIVVVISIVCL